jgi:ankyrin repeat protein
MANLLLEKGASITVKDTSDNTPLHLAFLHNFLDVAQVNIITETLIAKELIEMADTQLINSRNANGNSPLLLACNNRYVHLAKTLIEKGADVNTRNNFGDTPLLFASAQGYSELVHLLLSQGAEVNVQVKFGYFL